MLAGGGSFSNIYSKNGISVASEYVCFHKTIDVIVSCVDLAIKFPQTKEECLQNLTEANVNCVSVLDGLHIRIVAPSTNDREISVSAHFSCHHNTMGN